MTNRKIHKISGLIAGVVILILSITGFFLDHYSWKFLHTTTLKNVPSYLYKLNKGSFYVYLINPNDEKHIMIDEITSLKLELNKELMAKIQEGIDVNIYRQSVDALEIELKELYELNKRLAAIVLPVQQMYKDLVSEISAANGGNFFDIKA